MDGRIKKAFTPVFDGLSPALTTYNCFALRPRTNRALRRHSNVHHGEHHAPVFPARTACRGSRPDYRTRAPTKPRAEPARPSARAASCRIAGGFARRLRRRARPGPDASHRARRIYVEGRLGQRTAAFDRDGECVRLDRPAGPVCGAGALV